MDWMDGAFGEGWLGKLIAVAIGGVVAWFARRPAERAATIAAVDQRFDTLCGHLQAEVQRVTGRCDELTHSLREERVRCDEELGAMRAQINKMMNGPIPMYEVAPVRPRGK